MIDLSSLQISKAHLKDLPAILVLQYAAFQSEAVLYQDLNIPPLTQSLTSLEEEYKSGTILKACMENIYVGSVRAFSDNTSCYIQKLIVNPEFQNHGVGRKLMEAVERSYGAVSRYELFTGYKSIKNIQFYESLGYRSFKENKVSEKVTLIYLEKINPLVPAQVQGTA